MSYGAGAALQAAVYQRLVANTELAALVGDAIFDEVPAGKVPPTYVSLGTETVVDRSDADGGAAEHRFVVSVVSDKGGFGKAKATAVAISDAMMADTLNLARGRVVFLTFDRAIAKRDTSKNLRRIDLRFRARIEDNQT
ncbi:DUF3168 domain-containing protein [Shimia sp.]|uniref:DUF3168 domain-containing protein n=1 Tax=Shimia sp. TaxID=1954381 RepID=UPI003B8C2E68